MEENTKTTEEQPTKENSMKISDKDYAEFKQIEMEIAVAQRKIGDIEIRKAALINEAGQAMQKFKDYQIYLYKKHDLSMQKSYSINEETKEFVEVNNG